MGHLETLFFKIFRLEKILTKCYYQVYILYKEQNQLIGLPYACDVTHSTLVSGREWDSIYSMSILIMDYDVKYQKPYLLLVSDKMYYCMNFVSHMDLKLNAYLGPSVL